MRNKYPGKCYRCGKWVEKGDGHFERYKGSYRVQHADCCIKAKEQRIQHNTVSELLYLGDMTESDWQDFLHPDEGEL